MDFVNAQGMDNDHRSNGHGHYSDHTTGGSHHRQSLSDNSDSEAHRNPNGEQRSTPSGYPYAQLSNHSRDARHTDNGEGDRSRYIAASALPVAAASYYPAVTERPGSRPKTPPPAYSATSSSAYGQAPPPPYTGASAASTGSYSSQPPSKPLFEYAVPPQQAQAQPAYQAAATYSSQPPSKPLFEYAAPPQQPTPATKPAYASSSSYSSQPPQKGVMSGFMAALQAQGGGTIPTATLATPTTTSKLYPLPGKVGDAMYLPGGASTLSAPPKPPHTIPSHPAPYPSAASYGGGGGGGGGSAQYTHSAAYGGSSAQGGAYGGSSAQAPTAQYAQSASLYGGGGAASSTVHYAQSASLYGGGAQSSQYGQGPAQSASANYNSNFNSGAAAARPYDPVYAQQADQAVGANVRMISGCADHQTSADVRDVVTFGQGRGAGGACTNALLQSVQEGPTSWIGILRRMQRVLKAKRFKQVPQLSTSKVLDLQAPFEIMQPGGRHRSLLIGINYRGQRNELRGCHNDVFAMKRYITSQGFTETADTMCVLVDDGRHSSPTCATIVAGFRWLVDGARAGDSLFFHYSGHGGSVPDDNGDEADGMDETILPLDYLTAGQIRDDDIYKLLVKPLPHGVEFTIVMDCCHSGTIIDLPYSLSVDDELVHAMDAGQTVPQLKPNADFNMGKILGIGKHLLRMRKEGKTAMQIGSHAATALGLDKKLKKLGLGF